MIVNSQNLSARSKQRKVRTFYKFIIIRRLNLTETFLRNHLHGGFKGLDKQNWKTTIFKDKVVFTHLSPDGAGTRDRVVFTRFSRDGAGWKDKVVLIHLSPDCAGRSSFILNLLKTRLI